MHSPTVGSYGEAVSYERGTPVEASRAFSQAGNASRSRVSSHVTTDKTRARVSRTSTCTRSRKLLSRTREEVSVTLMSLLPTRGVSPSDSVLPLVPRIATYPPEYRFLMWVDGIGVLLFVCTIKCCGAWVNTSQLIFLHILHISSSDSLLPIVPRMVTYPPEHPGDGGSAGPRPHGLSMSLT